MTMINIDGREYDTDKFDEDQEAAFKELQLNQVERERVGYTMHLLELRARDLSVAISKGTVGSDY